MDQEAEEMDEIFPGFSSINDFAQKALTKLKFATKASNDLPSAGDDYDFYSSYEGFRQFCNSQGDRLLKNMQRLAGQHRVKGSQIGLSRTLALEDRMDALIETNDTLLETAGALLDEVAGVSKAPQTFPPDTSKAQIIVTSWNKKKSDEKAKKSKNFHLLHAKNILRPQLKFKVKVDNSNSPFVPIIKNKPNALKPLSEVFEGFKFPSDIDAIPIKQDSQTQTEVQYPHPYQFELDHFEPSAWQLEPVENPSYPPLEATPLTLVDNLEKLEELRKSLNRVKEFAVDLEHHSYRTYLGFTCLMQISTADHDYIVDTLELRSDLHVLNEAFTNPKIVKVLHGANMDIDWLQRDLGIYVVNMFDTGQASRTLGFPHHGLATLLSRYCQVEADKQYQLADWRIRPLPDEMLRYAREDTHYLLYIYHVMKNELIKRGNEQRNLLRSVLDQSKRICLQRYVKPIFTNESYVSAFQKNRKVFNKKQLQAFKQLFAWRDSMARQEDESPGYVLPMHMLFQISEILPKDQGGLLACCNPIPPLVKQNINEIHHAVLEARGYQDKTKSTTKEDEILASKTNTFSAPLMDPLESLLYCPHDNQHVEGQRLDRDITAGPSVQAAMSSSLLPDSDSSSSSTLPKVAMATPIITLFDTPTNAADQSEAEMTATQKKVQRLRASFANPFDMYMPLSKPRQIASGLLDADTISMNSKKSRDGKAPSFQPLSVWIMKKATPRPGIEKKPSEGTEKTYHTPVVFNPHVAKKRKAEEKIEIEEAEEEVDIPVRQMGDGSAKKRKHSDTPTGDTPRHKKDKKEERAKRRGIDAIPNFYQPKGHDHQQLVEQQAHTHHKQAHPHHKQHKDKQHHQQHQQAHPHHKQQKDKRQHHHQHHHHGNKAGTSERAIQPYDYSQTDYGMFQESQQKGREHHSHRGQGRGSSKGPSRSRMQQDLGRRSMTFSKHHGGKGSGGRGHWPKGQRR